MSNLTLVFGPRIPHELESIGLSFVAAPVLEPGSSIASLSTERYVRENYPHLDQIALIPSAAPGSNVYVSISYAGTDGGGLFGSVRGAFSMSQGVHVMEKQGYTLDILDSPMKVKGVTVTKAGSWAAEVTTGLCVRPYIVTGQEDNSSWIYSAFTALGSGVVAAGDKVYLIYTVPEVRYGQQSSYGQTASFPGADSRMRLIRETVEVLSPRTLSYQGRIKELREIKVNGVTRLASGSAFDNSAFDAFVERIDNQLGRIFLREDLRPRDRVEIEYAEYAESYTYTGYRDSSGVWYPFDGNPEWGHWIADPRVNELRPSADCLLEAVTVYLIPSAFVVARTRARKDGDPDNFGGQVGYTFVSAYDYGETHFVRHRVAGIANEQLLERMDDGSVNTWGYARFGVNHYDESLDTADDVFDHSLPFAMPLGRMVLAAPASVNSVSVADIRPRGGGVPVDFPMTAVTAQEDGLDRLRGFWDLGIWDGKVVKDGGVAEFRFDRSILNSFDSTEVQKFVRSVVPPGIAFEVIYV